MEWNEIIWNNMNMIWNNMNWYEMVWNGLKWYEIIWIWIDMNMKWNESSNLPQLVSIFILLPKQKIIIQILIKSIVIYINYWF